MSRRRTERHDEVERAGAPCRICGTWVRDGEGVELPRSAGLYPRRDGAFIPNTRPKWRRAHSRCAKLTYAEVVAKVIGKRSLPKSVAVAAVETAGVGAVVAFQAGISEAVAAPFGFISADERKLLREAAEQALADDRRTADGSLRRCQDGACGVCGVGVAGQWWESPLTWPDGSRAPFCDRCWAVVDVMVKPVSIDAIRVRAEYELAGVPPQMGAEAAGLRFYAELAGDDRAGTDERWGFIPSTTRTKLVMRIQDRNPRQVLDPLDRELALRRQRSRWEKRAAELAAKREAEIPGADLDWS